MVVVSLTVGAATPAEVVFCGEGAPLSRYRVAATKLSFHLRHPLQQVRGVLKGGQGSLEFHPESLKKGLLLRLFLPWKGIQPEWDPAKAWFAELSAPSGDAIYEFEAKAFELPPTVEKPEGVFPLNAIGTVGFRGKSYSAQLPLKCTVEREYWGCETRFEVSLANPLMVWGIPSRKLVTVEGEIGFGPQLHNEDDA